VAANGGTGILIYNWSNGVNNDSINNLQGGIYLVSVTDNNACLFVDTFNVGGQNNMIFGTVTNNELCGQSGTGVSSISISGGTAPFSYLWSTGSTSQTISNLTAGSYTATVTDVSGCTTTGTTVVSTPLVPLLNAIVLPTNSIDTVLTWNTTTYISSGINQTILGVDYQWIGQGPGYLGFGDSTLNATYINPNLAGNYNIILIATSNDGCITTDTILIEVDLVDPDIPNAFSPNGDGINDVFQVVDLDKTLLIEFKIFDKWGQLIYDNASEGAWDGTYMGVKQNRDAYIYVISWNSPLGGEQITKRGQVLLLR